MWIYGLLWPICHGAVSVRTVTKAHVVVVTGMSGAGRSTAINALEDLGFFCVDNLPPSLMPTVIAQATAGGSIERVGFGIDVRTRSFLSGASDVVDTLKHEHNVEVLFLDANDETLMRRFNETRRPHPLAPGGDVATAISHERERLSELRVRANQVVDTTGLSVHDLRRRVKLYMSRDNTVPAMVVRVVSFGFKYGVPSDADLMFDLRFLKNPYFVPGLREKTGLDAEVASYVLSQEEAKEFEGDVWQLLEHSLPRYARDGKAYLTIAVGCTGGKHRSVAMAEKLAKRLEAGHSVVLAHRDLPRYQ